LITAGSSPPPRLRGGELRIRRTTLWLPSRVDGERVHFAFLRKEPRGAAFF